MQTMQYFITNHNADHAVFYNADHAVFYIASNLTIVLKCDQISLGKI